MRESTDTWGDDINTASVFPLFLVPFYYPTPYSVINYLNPILVSKWSETQLYLFLPSVSSMSGTSTVYEAQSQYDIYVTNSLVKLLCFLLRAVDWMFLIRLHTGDDPPYISVPLILLNRRNAWHIWMQAEWKLTAVSWISIDCASSSGPIFSLCVPSHAQDMVRQPGTAPFHNDDGGPVFFMEKVAENQVN